MNTNKSPLKDDSIGIVAPCGDGRLEAEGPRGRPEPSSFRIFSYLDYALLLWLIAAGPTLQGISFHQGRCPMAKRHCAACHKVFEPYRHVPTQQYCSAPECQKVRRRRWQQHKLKSDSDYRDNQARAQRQWQQPHPTYWRTYQCHHPDYSARNRDQQRQRNLKRRHPPQGLEIAKMDAYRPASNPISGTYWLVPVSGEGIAKMDAYMVELAVVSTG